MVSGLENTASLEQLVCFCLGSTPVLYLILFPEAQSQICSLRPKISQGFLVYPCVNQSQSQLHLNLYNFNILYILFNKRLYK